MEIYNKKLKPVFNEEKELIEEKLNLKLPDNCWITGGSVKSVYLSIYDKKPILKFKCNNGGKFEIQKNEITEDMKGLTFEEILENEKDRLNQICDFCIDRLYNYVKDNLDLKYMVNVSGGKDSHLTLYFYYEHLSSILINSSSLAYKITAYIFICCTLTYNRKSTT